MTTPCIVCGATTHELYCRKNEYDFFRCTSCGLVRVDPPPSQAQLDRYYTEGYNQYRFSFERPLADPAKRKMHGLAVIERLARPGRLLDVGCAYGHFLENARRHGWRVEGVEPLSDARILAESRFRLHIHDHIAKAPSEMFDVATMWHVIEHLPSPVGFLHEVRDRIAPGGLLALATPNVKSLSARATGASWGWLSPPDHVVLYSRTTLPRLLEQNGFEVLHVETGRGPARNILLLLLQGLAYRLGVFGTMRSSVLRAARDYQTSHNPVRRFNLFVVAERITGALTWLLSPLLLLLWKAGLGDEVLVVARKRRNT